MSSNGVNKTLAGMKSGEVIRPAVDLDSCDSLASKAKGKRKREVQFYYYFDIELNSN